MPRKLEVRERTNADCDVYHSLERREYVDSFELRGLAGDLEVAEVLTLQTSLGKAARTTTGESTARVRAERRDLRWRDACTLEG